MTSRIAVDLYSDILTHDGEEKPRSRSVLQNAASGATMTITCHPAIWLLGCRTFSTINDIGGTVPGR
jgi:hypothetical protein